LREQARHAEAETLRTQELEPLLEYFRIGSESAPTLDARVAATMAEEAERVANATLLAELLAPMLGGRAHGDAVRPAAAVPQPEPPPAPRPNAAPRTEPARPAASIADFLDEMIAQESTPPRSPGAAQRRAS